MDSDGDMMDEQENIYSDMEHEDGSDIEMEDSTSDIEPEEKAKDEILDLASLESGMKEAITEIKETLCVSAGVSRILLQKFKWNPEELKDKFYESSDIGEFLKKHQLSLEDSESYKVSEGVKESESQEDTECDICCDTGKLIGLSCGHLACETCWKFYLAEQVKEGKSLIECMATKCDLLMPDEKVLELLESSQTYNNLIMNHYVQTNIFLKWCPGVNCGKAVKSEHVDPHLILCTCGTRFCFSCCNDWHDPINCRQMKLWVKKCGESSEDATWIIKNTKDCPKCLTSIEKNGGCNYIRCVNPKCGFQFCWICMNDWMVHKNAWYNCNSFDQNKETDRKEYRSNHDRYLFFYNRYSTHEQSLKLEKKLIKKVTKKMEQLQQLNMTWNEVQFLRQAVDTLSDCRRTMMYTYVFAYNLNRNNHSIIFESNQKDLEMATEQLSGFLEQDMEEEENLTSLKHKVQDKCRYVEHRRKVLSEHCAEGVEQGVWDFIEAK